jgi:hypothetical protein
LASGEAAPVLDLLIWTTDRWSSHATPSGRVAKLHAFVHEQLDRTGSCHHLVSQIKSMVSQIDQLSSRRASVEEVELVGFSEMQAMVVTTLLFLFSCWHQQVLLLSRRGDARTRGGKLRPRRVHSECGDARFTWWQTARLHQGGQAGDEVAPGWADGQSRSRRATSGRADDKVWWLRSLGGRPDAACPDANGGRGATWFVSLTTQSHFSVVFTGYEIGRPAGVLDAIWAPIICRPPRNWNLGSWFRASDWRCSFRESITEVLNQVVSWNIWLNPIKQPSIVVLFYKNLSNNYRFQPLGS